MALPLVLAGPILRRVEPRLCTVWIALREEARVSVMVWEGAQFATAAPSTVVSNDEMIAAREVGTRKFGEHLHVAVVAVPVVEGDLPFLPGHTYSYHVSFTGASGSSDLRAAGLLRDETAGSRIEGVHESAPLQRAIGYFEDRLPSFTMPGATLETLRIVHTSCRRPGAPLHDALAYLDDIIAETLDDPERPQQLYMTGDQIYADGVAATLLPMLTALGREVVGADEMLPVDRRNKVAGTIENLPALRRTKLLRFEARFTSGSASSHLMTFSEFAAMYLAVWSPRVWRPLATLDEVFRAASPDAAVSELLTRWEDCEKYGSIAAWRADKEKGVTDENAHVERFRAAVPRVAAALANIPSYMICDDHEITDDWNISKRWINRVYTTELGRAVVRNGLMAYGVFQGWGNDPAAFEGGNNAEFLKHTVEQLSEPDAVLSAAIVKLDDLLGLTIQDPKKQVKWHYQVPGPLHHTVVLDTRTQRTYRGQGYAPPDLLGATLKEQIPEGPLAGGREVLFVVSPVPVAGPQVMEQIGQPLAAIVQDFKAATERSKKYDDCDPNGYVVGSERRDVEGWSANEGALESLLERLAGYRTVVILSGDVHFGASMELDYYRKGKSAPARILQLIASPAHNTFDRKVQGLVRMNALLQRVTGEPAVERIAWKKAAPIVLPQGEPVPLTRLVRMKRSPALLIAEGWPPGTTVPEDGPPDWAWRLTLVRDERPNDALPTALRQPFLPPDAELSVLDPLLAYRALAARHATAAMTHFDHLRTVVFNAHIGMVRIEADDAGFTLVHSLLSQDAPDSPVLAPNTVHRMRLEPSPREAPVLKVRDG